MGIHDVATLQAASHFAKAVLQAIKAGDAAITETVYFTKKNEEYLI